MKDIQGEKLKLVIYFMRNWFLRWNCTIALVLKKKKNKF